MRICSYNRHTDTRSKVSVRKLSLVPNSLGTRTRLRTQKARARNLVESSHEPKAILSNCGLFVTEPEVDYHTYMF